MQSVVSLRTIKVALLAIGCLHILWRVPVARAAAPPSDVWVWQNPLPQGNSFHGVSCPSTTLCKAVGDGGTIYSWNGTAWSADVSPTVIALRAVSCASTTLCKAVGNGGTIVSWNGTTWSIETSGTTNGLNGVSCGSTTLCKAVGDGGTIASWNGTSWSSETSGTTNTLSGVACPSATLCKAVGHDVTVSSGAVLSWNGSAWSADTIPTTNQLYAVNCSSTTQCKAAGLFGAILSWDGSNWSADTDPFSTLRGVSCSSGTQCKAVGDSGIIGSWNGTTWSGDSSGTSDRLDSVSCPSGTLCKAVGASGRIISWNGSNWTTDIPTNITFESGLFGVSCPSSTFCKAVGFGHIVAWDGSAWSADTAPSANLLRVACPSTTLCKAVGFSGSILSWNGATWSADSSGTTANLNGIACSSTTLCKAVGDGGAIISWDGTSWSADVSNTTSQLLGVSCPSATLCKAVGNPGVIRSWDGSTWTGDTSGTSAILTDVSCPSTTLCKAVGSAGVIRSWNGTSWGGDTSNTTATLNGVSCPTTTRCKAVADSSAIISWNGSAWSADISPSANALSGVSCVTTNTHCEAVGGIGTILGTNVPLPPPTSTPTSSPQPSDTPQFSPTPANTATETPTPSEGGPNFVVNSSADTDDGACDVLGEGTGNHDCTLREAMNAANAHSGADTITFDIPSGSGCSSANVCTIALGSMLQINGLNRNGDADLTIDGTANGAKITLDGGNGVRIFDVFASTLTLNGLNLVHANGGALFTGFVVLTVTNCTFANNSLNGAGAAIRSENRPVLIVNSTFYNNSGTSSGAIAHGGASGSMTIINSTFASNTASFGATYPSAVLITGLSQVSLTLQNTIIARAPSSVNVNCRVDSGGALNADSHNVADDSSCGGATNTAILLDPLADNGGPTLTMALSSGSYPIDKGDDAVCSAPPVNGLDERGYQRPAGMHCDAGAFELGAAVPVPTATNTATTTPTNTPTATPTHTPTASPSNTPTATPTDTATASPSSTATQTASPTTTPTATPTVTSTPTSTNTVAAQDGDGVPDSVENGGPNGGDGNGDGTPDSEQDNVTSLPSAHGYVTVVVPPGRGGCSQLRNVHVVSEALLGTDPDFTYPYGLIGFTVNCPTSVDVTLILHEPYGTPLSAYRKYGPLPPLFDNPQFYSLPGVTFGSTQVPPGSGPSVTTVMFRLTNGEVGDSTPADDGTIVDPGGPAVTAASAPVTTTRGLVVLAIALGGIAIFALWQRGEVRPRRFKPRQSDC